MPVEALFKGLVEKGARVVSLSKIRGDAVSAELTTVLELEDKLHKEVPTLAEELMKQGHPLLFVRHERLPENKTRFGVRTPRYNAKLLEKAHKYLLSER
ncbi:hypothetical protein HY991_01865 [Candidatus Micrarchaeota archaeon]|nr:hypothetical protein [Candidatus Micrarchaeota archaeon]